MKKQNLKSLKLNKNSVSNLNQDSIIGGAADSSNDSARTRCMSCTRSCDPECKLTLGEETRCEF